MYHRHDPSPAAPRLTKLRTWLSQPRREVLIADAVAAILEDHTIITRAAGKGPRIPAVQRALVSEEDSRGNK